MKSLTKAQIDAIYLWPNSYERFGAFLTIHPICNGANYWYALRRAYESSDNLYRYREHVKQAFLRNEPGIETIMDDNERKTLLDLPETVTIYRGMTDEEFKSTDYNVSWTLKKEVAEYFCKVYGRNHDVKGMKMRVCELTVPKDRLLAFFKTRKEFEVIYTHNVKPLNLPSLSLLDEQSLR